MAAPTSHGQLSGARSGCSFSNGHPATRGGGDKSSTVPTAQGDQDRSARTADVNGQEKGQCRTSRRVCPLHNYRIMMQSESACKWWLKNAFVRVFCFHRSHDELAQAQVRVPETERDAGGREETSSRKSFGGGPHQACRGGDKEGLAGGHAHQGAGNDSQEASCEPEDAHAVTVSVR
eukprot:6210748-Pleurochrysis_carterae.AAC.1